MLGGWYHGIRACRGEVALVPSNARAEGTTLHARHGKRCSQVHDNAKYWMRLPARTNMRLVASSICWKAGPSTAGRACGGKWCQAQRFAGVPVCSGSRVRKRSGGGSVKCSVAQAGGYNVLA